MFVSCSATSDARATSGSRHRRSNVTLTVTLARLLVLHSSLRIFEEKTVQRDCSQSTVIVALWEEDEEQQKKREKGPDRS